MEKLILYISTSQNVFENLAFEEYLLTRETSDYLLLYCNGPAVVLGKHQNPWLEVNFNALEDQGITLARRLSGGGTVFHDEGNINFCFIRNKKKDFVNFREHIQPISKALNALGVPNSISERNDIFIKDFKISGNAEHVNNTKKRLLHHGTLLYNADLQSLGNSLKPNKYKIKTHAVSSVRSKVTNISDHHDLGMVKDFQRKLIDQLTDILPIKRTEETAPGELAEVKELVKTKFSTKEWVLYHTPQFTYEQENQTYKIRKGKVIESNDPKKLGLYFTELIEQND